MATKKILSNVLSDINTKWHKIEEDDSSIPVNTPLVIRVFNPEIIQSEDDDNIIFAEERRIGIYTDQKEWLINGPFPKYNYSGLVDDVGKLTENTKVSHWDIATSEDIQKYTDRLKNLIPWKYLDLGCDPSEEQSIYKALMFTQDILRQHYTLIQSLGFLDQSGFMDTNMKTMTELSLGLLHDLVAIIDMNHPIENKNETEGKPSCAKEGNCEDCKYHDECTDKDIHSDCCSEAK